MSKFISEEVKLTYDDVLLYPRESLLSRTEADISQEIDKIGKVTHPIIPANMDSIVSGELVKESLDNGGITILHRYMSFSDRILLSRSHGKFNALGFISIGVTEEEISCAEATLRQNPYAKFCIDIAHGHSKKVTDAISRLKAESNGKTTIIAGNVATTEGFLELAKAGVDIIKVGIGPGSHCTTRVVTGCGYPQLSAILEICKTRDELEEFGKYIYIIADGGIKNSGDMVKAIAAGADFVMTGSLFAGCTETPGVIVDLNGKKCKQYRGMASRAAQSDWFGKDVDTPEGEASLVSVKPPFSQVLKTLIGGIKSGMSYLNCRTIKELQKESKFIKVTANTLIENLPRLSG